MVKRREEDKLRGECDVGFRVACTAKISAQVTESFPELHDHRKGAKMATQTLLSHSVKHAVARDLRRYEHTFALRFDELA